MVFEITSGKIHTAKKVVIYGPEGIGKSTFASKFPDPLFSDTEGSTKTLDVKRLPNPTSFTMLMEEARYVRDNRPCKTYVVDTADWAEMLCINDLCGKYQLSGIEDMGYGKGYVYLGEEFGRWLNLLEDIIQVGINVVITAHAQMRKFEQPDELGAYDRWELKLQKKTAPLLKEWADMLLFANFKTMVINVDGQGATKGKNKAQGGKRVMYTTHHSCWDAKNRYGLPEECEFDYNVIRSLIEVPVTSINERPLKKTVNQREILSRPLDEEPMPVSKEEAVVGLETQELKIDPSIPRAVQDLMKANRVSEEEIQMAVSKRGYFPANMPVKDYPLDFINGVIIGAWPKLMEFIEKNRNLQF